MIIIAHRTPWYLRPFTALWSLLTGVIKLTGRLLAVILGVVLMIVGALLCLTIVGLVVGIPLGIVGLLLVIRGLF